MDTDLLLVEERDGHLYEVNLGGKIAHFFVWFSEIFYSFCRLSSFFRNLAIVKIFHFKNESMLFQVVSEIQFTKKLNFSKNLRFLKISIFLKAFAWPPLEAQIPGLLCLFLFDFLFKNF